MILEGTEIAGTISLFNVTGRPALSGMIGYWVDQRRAGRGLATAAVAAVLEVAWRDLGLHRVEAGTRADNVASQRVLEKNGFTRVGLLRRHLLIGGEWVDHLLWEKLEDD